MSYPAFLCCRVFFVMLWGVLLYAIEGLVLMLLGSGPCNNPYPDPWEDPKAETANFALYNPKPPALNSCKLYKVWIADTSRH